MDPREGARQAMEQASSKPVALVFGPERSGLANEELDLCSAIVYIPANPDYSSLNRSQAVQSIAYELRQQRLRGRERPPREAPRAGPAGLGRASRRWRGGRARAKMTR